MSHSSHPSPNAVAANPGTETLRRFGRAHLRIFLGLYLLFAAFTVLILVHQSEGDRRENWNVAATVGVVSGPFAGGIARGLQSCCFQFSMKLLPYAVAFPIGGLLLQYAPFPWPSLRKPFRLTTWSMGWFGWFGSAIISFAHALS